MRKNCCVNVVRTQPETQAALWHESMTEPVTQSMEIQTLPLFLPVDNRLLKRNDGSREYRRSRASSRSPGGSESQSPLSQPNFLCPLCQLLPRLREPGNRVDRCKTQITLPLRSCNPASIRFPTVRLWLHGAYFAQTASLSPVQARYLAFARISQILYMIRDTILSFSD